MAYIDLFSGPGRYQDGTKSTPLLIIEAAIASPDLCSSLIATFNDKDTQAAKKLENEIFSLPGIEKLVYKPRILCSEVDAKLAEVYSSSKLIPTLSFIDPFGYKGMTMRLIKAISKDWGSDSIFFFNYRRINAAIENESFRIHMDGLFGIDRLTRMRKQIKGMRPGRRLEYSFEMVAEVLNEIGVKFMVPFKFKNGSGSRTTHALIFATKNAKGFEIMKNIMAHESSTERLGVPSYEYNPFASLHRQLALSDPITEIADKLAKSYAGKTISVQSLISDMEESGSIYLRRNFKDAILRLEKARRVQTAPTAEKRWRAGKLTCGDSVVLTFPVNWSHEQ